MTRQFPILLAHHERRDFPDCPRSVPWDFLAPHEAQAQRNHYQSLERLAARGGLDPLEMLAILEDRDFGYTGDRAGAMRWAVEYLKQVNAHYERAVMQPHELDQVAHAIANQLHSMPRPQAQTGGAAPPALPEPGALAAQIRPHLTPEVVEMLSADPGAALGGGKHKFNFGNFVTNLNKILPLVTTLIGVFTGTPIPPITIPVPSGGPSAPPAS